MIKGPAKNRWKRIIAAVLVLTTVQVFTFTGSAEEAETAKTYNYQEIISTRSASNPDIQGWLYIQGTNINYPVVFFPADSNYYAARGYDKQYSYNGVIWADAMTRGGSIPNMTRNTVLYGHNWTNCSASPRIGGGGDMMFAQLPAFHYLGFAKEHQFINYSTNEENLVFQVFAVFYTEKEFAYNRSSPDDAQWEEIISGARRRSLHNYDIAVSGSDKIITLSTCTRAFGSSSRQRFVVMGKMVSDGTAQVSVSANPDYKKPSL